LAGLYDKQARYEKAEPLYQRALAIWEKASGRITPTWPGALTIWRGFTTAKPDTKKLSPFTCRALTILGKALGAEHRSVGICLENFGFLLRKMGRPQEAEPLEARARAIRAKNA
jgi:tetratricopeptide (TPR) repeat protein